MKTQARAAQNGQPETEQMYSAFVESLESIYYEGFAEIFAAEHPEAFTDCFQNFAAEYSPLKTC
jgi:hypothetical protein